VKICLLTARVPPLRCGVGDYTIQLGNKLASRGDEVVLLTTQDQAGVVPTADFEVRNTLPAWGARGMSALWREIHSIRPDVILVQWVPFLYSRTGTNLSFPLTVAGLAAKGFRVQLMVHEPWVSFIWWSYFLTGPVQRLALGILVSASRQVGVSITPWRDLLRARMPWKKHDIHYVPIGSNIPVVRHPSPQALRRQLGIPADGLVIGVFSLYGAAKAFSSIESAWRDLSARRDDCYLVLVGASAEEAASVLPQAARHPRCRVTGYLAAEDVSGWMQTIDLLLAPFSDGMSSRRTSVMAALAHGVPVVTTRGRLTDAAEFDRSPLILSDLSDEAFSRAVSDLCDDAAQRSRMAAAAPAFYEQHFGWGMIAERLIPGDDRRSALAARGASAALHRGR